jgi:cell division protein FtsL
MNSNEYGTRACVFSLYFFLLEHYLLILITSVATTVALSNITPTPHQRRLVKSGRERVIMEKKNLGYSNDE